MSITILSETLSYLRFNFIWPDKSQELNPGKLFYVKFAIMLMSTTVILIGSTLHLIVSIQHNSNNIFEDIVILVAEIGVDYFNTIFVSKQRQIAGVYSDLCNFEKFEKPYHFKEKNQRLLTLSKMDKNFMDVAILGIALYPVFTKHICEKQNEVSDFKEFCGFLVTTWMPFDIDIFPVRQILYLWQCYTITFTMKAAGVTSFAIMESMEHLVIRIQHLKVILAEAINTEECHLRQELFTKAIKYHLNIFDLGKRIDQNYTGCLFLHVVLSGALFGCIGYKLMEGFTLNSLCIFGGWVLSLFIVCISGQHLIDEVFYKHCLYRANSVADAAYDSNWYDRDIQFQKNISLIILRSQTPIVVHAGPFSYVSHIILLTIFKTAYSYLTLLNATSV